MSVDLRNNTVAQYKMNDNAATDVVIDSRGYSDGTYVVSPTSTKSVAGKINTALDFPVFNVSYVNTNNTFNNTLEKPSSLNIWFNADYGSGGGELITIASYATDSFFIDLNNLGEIYFLYTSAAGGLRIETTVEHNLGAGKTGWHMLTIVIEQTTPTLVTSYIYLDSILLSTASDSGNLSGFDSGNLCFGGVYPGGAGMFKGELDNFCIFDKVISQGEIDFLYNRGTGTEELSNITPTDETVYEIEEADYTSAELIFDDGIGGFTGNGYMICKEFEGTHYKTLNYPIRAINPDTYNLWMRVINPNSNSLEMEILIDGSISKTISSTIGNPSDGLEWSWVNTTLILPDNREHILGIKIKENNIVIDKIYIDADFTLTPEGDGPIYSISPYITTHVKVFDGEENTYPTTQILAYDYKTTIDEIVQDDWYNFNISVLDGSNADANPSSWPIDNYFIVLTSSGDNPNNYIIWEMLDTDEYMGLLSAITISPGLASENINLTPLDYYKAKIGDSDLEEDKWYINYNKRYAFKIYSDYDPIEEV